MHSYRDITIIGEALKNLDVALHLWCLNRKGSSLAVTRDLIFLVVSSEGLFHLVSLLDEQGVLRTF